MNLSTFLMIMCGTGVAVSDDGGNCQECGRDNEIQVVTGELPYGIYPMMAALVDTEKRRIACAATIVNRRQVLTAASCFTNVNSLAVITEQDTLRTNGYDGETSTRIYRISNATRHNRFVDGDDVADIAMVTVDGTFEYSKALRSTCLPFNLSPDSLMDKGVMIVYWMSEAQNALLSNKKVEATYGSNARVSKCLTFRRNLHLCTTEDNKEFCDMHPGAPVFWRDPATNALVLVGIRSRNFKCDLPSITIHTAVSAFMDWIQEASVPDANYCKNY